MTDRFSTPLFQAQQAHQALQSAWAMVKPGLIQGKRYSLEIKPETRSTASNRLWWSILNDIASQVTWPVDGKAQRLEPEEWKDILSAGLKKSQRVAQGIEGGFVMLGQRTSKMSQAEMSELIELAYAFGAQHSVTWSRTSLGRDVPDEAAS